MSKNNSNKQTLNRLFVSSAKDLIKFKSFIWIILLITIINKVADYLLFSDKSKFRISDLKEVMSNLSPFLFERLPQEILSNFNDWRLPFFMLGAFAIKEIISLWPSNDMRRMHRDERHHGGIFTSLLHLRWSQVLWDAIAVGSIVSIGVIWSTIWFFVFRAFWQNFGGNGWAIALIVISSSFLPFGLCAFSYSSKLAVVNNSSFAHRFKLFFRLFYDPKIFIPSFLWFFTRSAMTALIATLPIIINQIFDQQRLFAILLGVVVACPIYSYLKLVSFKVFLHVYRNFNSVFLEYQIYYRRHFPEFAENTIIEPIPIESLSEALP